MSARKQNGICTRAERVEWVRRHLRLRGERIDGLTREHELQIARDMRDQGLYSSSTNVADIKVRDLIKEALEG